MMRLKNVLRSVIAIALMITVVTILFWESYPAPADKWAQDNDKRSPTPVRNHLDGRVKVEDGDKLHVAVVLCNDRLEEVLTLLKSLVIFEPVLVLHAFVEVNLQERFAATFSALVASAPTGVDWTTHTYDAIYPDETDAVDWKELFKPCATLRIFLPDLLPQVTWLLYIDSDTLVLQPLQQLWAAAKSFNDSQALGLVPETEDVGTSWYTRFARHPFYGDTGLNSGILLMNLDRLRKLSFSTKVKALMTEYSEQLTYGDQDLINIYAAKNPDQIFPLGCMYNYRPDHCMYGHNCASASKNGVAILHGSRGYFHPRNDTKTQPPYREMWDAFQRYDLGGHLRLDLYNPLSQSLRDIAQRGGGLCANVYPLFLRGLESRMRR